MPETKLEYIITHYFKADTKAHLKSHPEDAEELLNIKIRIIKFKKILNALFEENRDSQVSLLT